jgi:hypothetical protein
LFIDYGGYDLPKIATDSIVYWPIIQLETNNSNALSGKVPKRPSFMVVLKVPSLHFYNWQKYASLEDHKPPIWIWAKN